MVKRLSSEIEIDAPPEHVWELLTDTQSYPRWNPFVRKFQGELRPGSRVSISLKLFGRGTVPFRPEITQVQPNHELRWLATLGLRGLFDVDRRFVIHERGDGGVRFEQGEDCTGILTPVMFAFDLERRILRGYRRMNLALKERAEQPGQ